MVSQIPKQFPWASQIQSLPRTFRILIILFAVILIVVLLQYRNQQTDVPLCDLLQDGQLRKSEIHQIELALSQAGLSEYKIENNRLLIPRDKRATYLQAIAEQNAVPERLLPNQDHVKRNPFLSHSQQQSLERDQKKRQIREMVMRLPFVDEAWFEMDAAASGSAFEPVQRTAGVTVRPHDNATLTRDQVATIRQMISGALAGIDAQQIVVTDVNAGIAYCKGNESQVASQNLIEQAAFEIRQDYEQKIRQSLAMYDGLKIEVHLQGSQPVNSRPIDSTDKKDEVAATGSNPSEVKEKDGSDPATIVVGTNGQASIVQEPRGLETTDKKSAINPSPAYAQIDSSRGVGPLSAERVSVSIAVPFELIDQQPHQPESASSWQNHPPRPVHDIDSIFEQIKTEIVEKVRPLLPIASFDNSADYPISVTLLPAGAERASPPIAAEGIGDQLRAFARSQWTTIAVFTAGIFLLMLAVRKPRPIHDQRASPGFEAANSGLADSEDKAEILAMKEQISQLIDRDPDTAANVLKQWIRDAA